MTNKKPKRKLRSVLIWILWVLLAQFILINISAALYAYKLTHLYSLDAGVSPATSSKNIFAKTWRLFTGPRFYKEPLSKVPGFNYSIVQLKTKNDISIEGWYSKPDTGSRGTVILFHGLGGNKGMILDEAVAFKSMGYSVLLLDTRSNGNSGGVVTTIGYKEAEEVRLAYDHIARGGEKNIYLWGVSMGAVEIIKAVSDYDLKPAGIIVEMPFLSLESHLKGRARLLEFPSQPFAFLTTFWIGAERGFNGFGFKTTRFAKNIHCPVLEQYGAKDELVLKKETDDVYNTLASMDKKLVVYEDAKHESFLRKDPAAWKREVGLFLEAHTKLTF